jgi:hypothetical protein
MKQFILILVLAFGFVYGTDSIAAVGCDLNDPDRDVARLFPESTGYKTIYLSVKEKGGEPLLKEIENRLGDRFQGMFETIDVPYTLYEIYRNKEKIGYIHGVNQKGKYGGIQVFLSLDLDGNIQSFYFQKLTSKAAKKLRDPEFTGQFNGLNLSDFYDYDVVSGKTKIPGRVSAIHNPEPEAEYDFKAALRATKKNLILIEEFVYGNKHLKSE